MNKVDIKLINAFFSYFLLRVETKKHSSKKNRRIPSVFLRFDQLVEAFHRVLNHFHRLVASQNGRNGRFFSFQLFVNFEEMADFVENMLWQISDIVIAVQRRIVPADRDDLFVRLVGIDHFNDADRIAMDQTERNNRLLTHHQNVQRVAVSGICPGNEPVVLRIMRRGV